MQRTRSGRKSTTDPAAAGAPGRAKQRAVCIASLPSGEDFAELEELLRTAGVAVVGTLVQHRQNPHPNSYLGPGKLVELKEYAKECDANVIACDDELSPRQERNLEQELGIAVVDRTTVILDIFAAHAGSAEGKLQVELAQLEYNLARMRGLWTHLERLGGGIGTRGPGETQIETDRRLARDRIAALRRRLAGVQSSREVMRAERSRARLPELALAGYTNTGKSTLLGALTGAPVPVADRLFHTLDPMTRTLRINGRAYLATDTVGFIRKLPHQLVDAFGATLEETRRAALIVHVADASATDDELDAMKRSVEDVLDEIGAGDQARILVLNKIDLLDPDRLTQVRNGNRDAMLVSGVTGEGIDDLRDRIEEEFLRTLRSVDLLLPYADGASLAELHDLAGELKREDTPNGVRVSALLPPAAADRFERFAVAATGVVGANRSSPNGASGPEGQR
jgi:GTP-binding protein HflX